jgi:hypothetical protein
MEKRLIGSSFYDTLTSILVHRGFAINMLVVLVNLLKKLNRNEIHGIVFPFIIWFYGSAIVIIRGWGCGFGNSEDIVT